MFPIQRKALINLRAFLFIDIIDDIYLHYKYYLLHLCKSLRA